MSVSSSRDGSHFEKPCKFATSIDASLACPQKFTTEKWLLAGGEKRGGIRQRQREKTLLAPWRGREFLAKVPSLKTHIIQPTYWFFPSMLWRFSRDERLLVIDDCEWLKQQFGDFLFVLTTSFISFFAAAPLSFYTCVEDIQRLGKAVVCFTWPTMAGRSYEHHLLSWRTLVHRLTSYFWDWLSSPGREWVKITSIKRQKWQNS